ncbi:MAG: ribose transport system substrate-binding protein [Sphingomonadales bacterium]|jgi:ribose transport system substrate-binding protein|nr:ribose transport system substrate-binding protein [Sphingomonadales bacterium]
MSARPDRSRVKGAALLVLVALLAALVLSACGGGSSSSSSTETTTEAESESESESGGGEKATAAAGSEAWCGEEGVTLGIQDGGGLNAWSKESLEQVQVASKACPAVEKEIVVDADFEPQKAVSGIQSMIAQGANAIVLIPDSGNCAEVPAMRQAMQHNVVVVPWAAYPCGTEGTDYTKYVDWDTKAAGREWAEWVIEQMGGKGKLLYEGGPAGNTVSSNAAEAVAEVVSENPGVELVEPISAEEWPVTNWDPAETKKITAAILAKNPEINGLVNDYGASAEAEIQAFQAAGREVPAIATSESNALGCSWKEAKEAKEEFPLLTISSRNWLGRYAAQFAIAEASGGTPPALKNNGIIDLGQWENSVSGKEPKCEPSAGPEVSFSNQMSEEEMNEIALEG